SRPSVLNNEHNYNLQNQGWTSQQLWSTSATQGAGNFNFTVSGTSLTTAPGSYNFTVGTVSGAAPGQQVVLSVAGELQYSNNGNFYPSGFNNTVTLAGIVTAYTGGVMTVNITTGGTWFTLGNAQGISAIFTTTWFITESNVVNTINTFKSGVGVYPSNSDIW